MLAVILQAHSFRKFLREEAVPEILAEMVTLHP